MGKVVKLDGKVFEGEKPNITLGRAIARVPVWENQLKFQEMFFQLLGEGYKLHQEDFTSMGWWGVTVASARNRICAAAMERKSDYVMFIDDDMTADDMAVDIKKMIALDKDIVFGIMCTKGRPHTPNVGKITKIGESKTICDSITQQIYDWPDKPFKCDLGSTAYMLIKRKVLEKLGAPWFYMPPNYTNGNIFGEDLTFCFNARMHGFEVWADPSIRLGHLGIFAWNHQERSDNWLDYEQQMKDVCKREKKDYSCKLDPKVQKVFKKGEGNRRIYV
jgi:hypothetical protein